MVLNVFALLFVLGITFIHSLFGLFSGIINVFCTITALAVAFGCAEPLTRAVAGNLPVPPEYVVPAALVLLFVVTLLVLRILADNVIRGNVRVPMYVDWAGGAVCGFVNAQICVGVMVLSFLLLPWGGRVMMYSRQERDPENTINPETGRVEFHTNPLWLRSDQFTAGLFSLLSQGSLRGDIPFASVYPNFPEWVFWTGNQVQSESSPTPVRDGKTDGFDEKGIKVETWWTQTAPLAAEYTRYRKEYPTKHTSKPPFAPQELKPDSGKHLLGARLTLNSAAADQDKGAACHRFRPSNIRLVGDIVQPDGSLEPREYVPAVLGGADSNLGDMLRIVEIDDNFSVPAAGETPIDAYFEVDEGFKPRFVEYRRYARAPLTGQPAKTPPAERLAVGAKTQKATDTGHGPARFIDAVVREGSGGLDRLPLAIARDKLTGDVELKGDLFVSGRVWGERAALGEGAGNKVEKFEQPEDKRIFQLQTKPRKAQSLFGKVFNFVGARTNQYHAVDREGTSYMLAGYYAIVKRDGKDFVELYFSPDPEGTGSRGMVDLKEVKFNELEHDDSILGLIFLVPPGKTIVAVQSQGGRVDFGTEFLVGQ